MLRRDSAMSVSILDGFRQRSLVHVGRGLLPLLAVMLLAAPQLAMAQGGLAVTVNPRVLEITEGDGAAATGEYTVVLDAEPSENVTITVVGAPTEDADITVGSTATGATTTGGTLVLTFTAPDTPGDTTTGNWSEAQTVTVTGAGRRERCLGDHDAHAHSHDWRR